MINQVQKFDLSVFIFLEISNIEHILSKNSKILSTNTILRKSRTNEIFCMSLFLDAKNPSSRLSEKISFELRIIDDQEVINIAASLCCGDGIVCEKWPDYSFDKKTACIDDAIIKQYFIGLDSKILDVINKLIKSTDDKIEADNNLSRENAQKCNRYKDNLLGDDIDINISKLVLSRLYSIGSILIANSKVILIDIIFRRKGDCKIFYMSLLFAIENCDRDAPDEIVFELKMTNHENSVDISSDLSYGNGHVHKKWSDCSFNKKTTYTQNIVVEQYFTSLEFKILEMMKNIL